MKQAMHTQHSDNLQKAAQAVLSGNRQDSISILETELVEDTSCTSTWLLYAMNCDSLSEAEDAINQVLETEPENELAATGRRWFEGLRNLASQIEAGEETEAEALQAAEEEAEAQRVAEEEAEAQRVAEEEEAEAQRIADEEAEARRVAEEEEAEAQRAEEEAEAQRIADEEAEARRVAEEEEAEAQRAEEEAEAQRIADEEAEARRVAEEEEAEAQRAEEEAEAQRVADEEAEARRVAQEEEAEAQRAEEEAEAERKAQEEEELRLAEEDRLAEEAEARRLAEAEEAELRSQESEEENEIYDAVNELVDGVKSTTTPQPFDVAALASDQDQDQDQDDSENEQADTSAELESNEKPFVLAVDDSPTIRKLVSMTLSRAGFEVVAAADGVEALTLLADRAPSIILSDINMPRLDGYKLCKFVKRNQGTKHIPVILLSGKDGVFDKMRGKMSGCDGYITKPFESNDLLEKVKSFTGVTV